MAENKEDDPNNAENISNWDALDETQRAGIENLRRSLEKTKIEYAEELKKPMDKTLRFIVVNGKPVDGSNDYDWLLE